MSRTYKHPNSRKYNHHKRGRKHAKRQAHKKSRQALKQYIDMYDEVPTESELHKIINIDDINAVELPVYMNKTSDKTNNKGGDDEEL